MSGWGGTLNRTTECPDRNNKNKSVIIVVQDGSIYAYVKDSNLSRTPDINLKDTKKSI